MIITIVLYIGLTIGGVYTIKKTTEVINHVVTEDTERYKACMKETKNAKRCRELQ